MQTFSNVSIVYMGERTECHHFHTPHCLALQTVFLLALMSARRALEIPDFDILRMTWNPSGVSVFVNDDLIPKCHMEWHQTQPTMLPATFDHATWRSENMFTQFYQLDIFNGSRTELGRRVLGLASLLTMNAQYMYSTILGTSS